MNMKKMLAVGATALCATVGFAELASANIVGYNGTTLAAGNYYMVAVQFDSVAGDGAGIAIKDLVTGDLPYGMEMQIQKADGTYDIYKYLAEAYDAVKDDFVPGWGDGGDNIATRLVAPGTVFWLKSPSATEATIAGAILADASKEFTFASGKYSMLGNPYPVAANPNTLTWTGLTYKDELQVLKIDGTYNIYKYLEETYDAVKDDFVPGWGDGGDNYVTTGIIPVGQGAWIKPAATVTATFASPL